MFSTTTTLTAKPVHPADTDRAAAAISAETAAEIQTIRTRAAAGELTSAVAQQQITGAHRRGAGRLARLTTLGRNGAVTTLELETWHGDQHDHDSVDLRAELMASGLL